MTNLELATALQELALQLRYPDERPLPGFVEIAELLEEAATKLSKPHFLEGVTS